MVYRAFCRIDGERVPDAKTLIRLAHLLDEPVLKDVLARLVTLGRERALVRGRRLRVDTTVVETNIHYPTDTTLLADGVRVLTRTLRRLGSRSASGRAASPVGSSRSPSAVARPAPRVSAAVRERSKAKMKVLYQGLMRITRAVVRQAEPPSPGPEAGAPGRVARDHRLVRHVLAQTRARVLRAIRTTPASGESVRAAHRDYPQGKLAQPTEFGRLVKIQEAEAQFITDYAVCAHRPDGSRALGARLRASRETRVEVRPQRPAERRVLGIGAPARG